MSGYVIDVCHNYYRKFITQRKKKMTRKPVEKIPLKVNMGVF